MTRTQASALTSVALLATGDEICNGDILNSNSPEMAQRLFKQGIHVVTHMTVPDNLMALAAAMQFLLQNHRALIITGGLGPTSDDLTRQALSQVLQCPLIFDEPTWQAIVTRLQRFGFHAPPESNKQQALFPPGATIIPNPNGTAAGCIIKRDFQPGQKDDSGQFIFMLPGPPSECLPMFDNAVLPTLKHHHFQKNQHYETWLLFGVSEAQIAEELDALAQPFDCITGYRFWYPYIEFKLYSNNHADFIKLVPLIEKTIAPYLIGNGKITASDLLKKTILSSSLTLAICDFATGGLLESLLKTPDTHAHLNFFPDIKKGSAAVQIKISGLVEFWQQIDNSVHTFIEISFTTQNNYQESKNTLPFRGPRVKHYAVEFICWQIYKFLITAKEKSTI